MWRCRPIDGVFLRWFSIWIIVVRFTCVFEWILDTFECEWFMSRILCDLKCVCEFLLWKLCGLNLCDLEGVCELLLWKICRLNLEAWMNSSLKHVSENLNSSLFWSVWVKICYKKFGFSELWYLKHEREYIAINFVSKFKWNSTVIHS